MDMGMLLDYYMSLLDYYDMPKFMQKYLNSSSLRRLKNIGYFCGMDYASKDVYSFYEKITRYHHSLTVALLVHKFTNNREKTLAGLFHDVASPCFCHAIDYMNGDYSTQESTEHLTKEVIMNDRSVLRMLQMDEIAKEDIIYFKKFPIVDCPRPMLCADRLDGIILTGIGWLNCFTKQDLEKILFSLRIYRNEFNVDEFGFHDVEVARMIYEVACEIDKYCHSKDDNYMMQLLADITRACLNEGLFLYDDLFVLDERDIFGIIERSHHEDIKKMVERFKTIRREEIPHIELPYIKIRDINPLVKGKRLIT